MWGRKFQNTTPPTAFIQPQPYFIRAFQATIAEYRPLLFFASITFTSITFQPSFIKILWHFEILTYMGVNDKILKTADRRADLVMKIWDSQSYEYELCSVQYFSCLSSVWGHSVH